MQTGLDTLTINFHSVTKTIKGQSSSDIVFSPGKPSLGSKTVLRGARWETRNDASQNLTREILSTGEFEKIQSLLKSNSLSFASNIHLANMKTLVSKIKEFHNGAPFVETAKDNEFKSELTELKDLLESYRESVINSINSKENSLIANDWIKSIHEELQNSIAPSRYSEIPELLKLFDIAKTPIPQSAAVFGTPRAANSNSENTEPKPQ